MEIDNLATHIRNLEDLIQSADTAYYYGVSRMPDNEYDAARVALAKLKPDSPVLNRVGAPLVGDFEKVEHIPKMYSLKDVFTIEDIKYYCTKMSGLNGFVAEFKLDGLAIELEYKAGILTTASTRGDGDYGENVTHSVRTIKNIPLIFSEPIDVIVRGEVVIPKNKFKLLTGFANARNAAAGSVRQKDPAVSATRHLAFYAYTLVDSKFDTHEKSLQYIESLGFEVVRQIYCPDANSVVQAYKELIVKRPNLSWDIDGMVVKINNHKHCADLGEQGRYPRWAIACKFENPLGMTRLIGIELQKGRTGNITPVAILDPVTISGSTITRASLHNNSEIQRKGIYINALVMVEKAGEIIPEVVSVVSKQDLDDVGYCMPDICPDCGQPLDKTYLNWRCLNKDCCVEKQIEYFVSKRCMDIQGLGPKLIKQLVDAKLIDNFADLYKFFNPTFAQQVMNLPGWSDTRVASITKNLQEMKVISAAKFYMSLGIPTLGESKSQILAKLFPQPKNILERHYNNVPFWMDNHLGSVCAAAFKTWMSAHHHIYKSFLDNVTIEDITSLDSVLTFLFTGTLSRPRTEFEKRVIRSGHRVAKSISRSVNYLVVGEKPGSKLTIARSIGINVIDEKTFNTIMEKY